MKLLIGIIIFLLIVGVIAYVYWNKEEQKPVPTIQYTKPIGPTQQPPYRLPSNIIEAHN